MKPAKCPFYPDSCTVEFHPNMQHVWRTHGELVVAGTLNDAALKRLKKEWEKIADSSPAQPITNITNKASERAQAWNKANRKQYNARQKLLMAGKRAKRGG